MKYLRHTTFVADSFALGLKQDGVQTEPLPSNPSTSDSEPDQVNNNCTVESYSFIIQVTG